MDTENTPVDPVAPESNENQSEQAVAAEATNSPEVASDQEEKLYAGKFKSPEDMEKSYQELQSKFTKTAQEKAELERLALSQQEPEQANEAPYLDPDSAAAVRQLFREEQARLAEQAEMKKSLEFERKHADELQDKVLSGTVLRIMQEARQNQTYLEQEDALAQAKELLDSRIKPQVREAQIQAEKVGSNIAQKKAELGRIGETPSSQKIDPKELSADEYAKYFNLPRA